jgi:hypothetical protein
MMRRSGSGDFAGSYHFHDMGLVIIDAFADNLSCAESQAGQLLHSSGDNPQYKKEKRAQFFVQY